MSSATRILWGLNTMQIDLSPEDIELIVEALASHRDFVAGCVNADMLHASMPGGKKLYRFGTKDIVNIDHLRIELQTFLENFL